MLLDEIIANTKKEVNEDQNNYTHVNFSNISFLQAFTKNKIAIIAELKSKSPSEGLIKKNYIPQEIALKYEAGGACALSILTDFTFFGGSFKHMQDVREVCQLPILCKDFIIDPKQVRKARYYGANACLLIVRVLSDKQLLTLKDEIENLGMTALIEIFDEIDLKRALKVSPELIGINNRNLNTLEINKNNTYTLSKSIPAGIKVISLSGAKTPNEAYQSACDFDGVLIGTALMKSNDAKDFLQKSIKKENSIV